MARRPHVSKEVINKAIDDVLIGKRKQIDVAAELGVTRQAVSLWIKKRQNPKAFIRPKKKPVPVPEMPKELGEQVVELVLAGPPSKYGLQIEGDQWVPVIVRDLISKELKREIGMPTIYAFLALKNLPVQGSFGAVEGYRKRGRPRMDDDVPGLPDQAIVRKPLPSPESEPELQLGKDEVELADMDYYKSAVEETRAKMAKEGRGSGVLHGVRTGKHSKGGTKKKKKRRR
ncbi:hypothetical protein N9059_01910 [bacterium]|nr:hypothetical protein [bacterium]